MVWKEKIEQLAALLEKIPQAQSFEVEKGVYQPYFVLDLRPANWEILPYAEYTRLDGKPGKELKLNLQILESQKVNISEEEINVLSYIYSFTNYDTRRLFNYGQPVGFLLDWLRSSRLKVRDPESKNLFPVEMFDEIGDLSLGLYREGDTYVLQPAIVFPDHSIIIDDSVYILTANPIYLFYKNVIYRVNSNLPPFFWINFFRIQKQVEIPMEELGDFITSFVPKILPALDWKSLEDHLKKYELPLDRTRIYLSERAGHLVIDVFFVYRNSEFPAYPIVEKSLATEGKYLYVVKRNTEREAEIRKLLHESGLFYLQHRWQLDPQYKVLDWLRLKVPELAKQGIEFFGEDRLHRFRLRRSTPTLRLQVVSGTDWLELKYRIELDGELLPVNDFFAQIRQGKNYIKLADGSNIYLDDQRLNQFKQALALLEGDKPEGVRKFHLAALPVVEDLLQMADETITDDTFRKWQQNYREFKEVHSVALPTGFQGKLRDYQQAGLDWLYFLHRMRIGGILADDMGLGKTVQVIALLEKLREEGELKNPALIVVPVTVLFNWESEIRRFAPELRVLRYQGQKSEREKLQKQFSRFHVVLLSYGIVLQDQETLIRHPWSYLILDESQKIKNPATKTYQAVTRFQVEHRLCLTGTPVENSIMDLWSQLNFLNPGMLGSFRQFENRFGGEAGNDEENQKLLRKLIYPFILRRSKEEVVKELPDRTEIVQYVEMTDKQREIYEQGLAYYRKQIFEQIHREGMNRARMKILEALTYLRQVACHPAILDENAGLYDSGKIELLDDMLEEILQEGHKVLVFSQFVRFLKLVRTHLDLRDWQYEYLDGTTRDRQTPIRNFQENPEVKIFLISLKAGGLGLNLTAADYVIHLDPWWNPAVEQQATDRVHRIGQQNRVFVYKYIMKNSVEEKVLELQQKKQDLFRNLITTEKGLMKQLTVEDLEIIFRPLSEK